MADGSQELSEIEQLVLARLAEGELYHDPDGSESDLADSNPQEVEEILQRFYRLGYVEKVARKASSK
jgi:hypothetical protein